MGKSIRSKREKRLRAIRREMVEPLYDQKDAAKFSAAEAALAAPKLPVRLSASAAAAAEAAAEVSALVSGSASAAAMDIEMDDGNQTSKFLKPMGKKLKKRIKIAKKNYRGKGKIRRKNI